MKNVIKITKDSLDLVKKISDKIDNQTFHHHFHILYDIANTFDNTQLINYLEIGCYAGASACLMLQRPNTNVISIDLGDPISENTVFRNVSELNTHRNNYNYIKGNSHDPNTLSKLEEILSGRKLDILFIDGDHTFDGVKKDFQIYSRYLKEGGYIVFDDYNDHQHSPEVKKSVDGLDLSSYEILGEFGNEFGARPEDHKPNEFVIQKKKFEKIGIVISTYYRPDGKTKAFLTRALESLKSQTNLDFKVFLIGDKYQDDDEFKSFSSLMPNMYIENLSYAKEREKYTGKKLWCSGGVNAINVGIEKAKSEGYDWIINMDHDDYFLQTHIETIKKTITKNCVFVCSNSTQINSKILPKVSLGRYIPVGSGLIKSSACINFSKINITFRDVFAEENRVCASDADLWNRLGKFILEKNYESYCTGWITCIHDEEGYIMNT